MNKKFRNFIITTIIISVIFFGLSIAVKALRKSPDKVYNRSNTECLTDERVFDNADVLTDEEEEKLRELIYKNEKKIGCDIVLVTIDEYVPSMMNYADDYYDDNMFGFDKPCGDGVLLLDNWDTEEMWVTTTGKVMEKYNTDAKVDMLLDEICEDIDESPYKAYKAYVESVTRDMLDSRMLGLDIGNSFLIIISFIVAIIFLIVNLSNKGDVNKPEKNTYTKGSTIDMKQKEDSFISTSTSKRKIQSSSSGHSSGGAHRSRSGTSHGGGGRRH